MSTFETSVQQKPWNFELRKQWSGMIWCDRTVLSGLSCIKEIQLLRGDCQDL